MRQRIWRNIELVAGVEIRGYPWWGWLVSLAIIAVIVIYAVGRLVYHDDPCERSSLPYEECVELQATRDEFAP